MFSPRSRSTTASQSVSRRSSFQSRSRISGPRLFGKASRAFAHCPAASTSGLSAARGAKIFARQQPAGADQYGVDLGQFFGKSILLIGVFGKAIAGVVVRRTGRRRGIGSGASLPRARPAAALPFAAAQRQNADARKRPVGWVQKNAASAAQHGMRPGELVGRGAGVHMGIVQDEVFGMDKLAVEPQRRRRVGKMLALDKAVADRAFVHALVEARQKVFGAGERPDQGVQGQIGKIVSH
ncbi:hypothetical protein [Mesorhizobium sp.]|uniref:hypothetical protein n=1 Tax=Mesorhizobium sp. TaxID=1871066 RepID=UPI00257DA5EB|nr:hypothetical protein [Mesorhizobium sp.]